MSKDAVKPNLPASNGVAFDHDPVRTQSDPSAEALGKLIAEALADFDPEFPSERRLKLSPARPPVTFPRTWAKKAG
jgi:hypothetical protein